MLLVSLPPQQDYLILSAIYSLEFKCKSSVSPFLATDLPLCHAIFVLRLAFSYHSEASVSVRLITSFLCLHVLVSRHVRLFTSFFVCFVHRSETLVNVILLSQPVMRWLPSFNSLLCSAQRSETPVDTLQPATLVVLAPKLVLSSWRRGTSGYS